MKLFGLFITPYLAGGLVAGVYVGVENNIARVGLCVLTLCLAWLLFNLVLEGHWRPRK